MQLELKIQPTLLVQNSLLNRRNECAHRVPGFIVRFASACRGRDEELLRCLTNFQISGRQAEANQTFKLGT